MLDLEFNRKFKKKVIIKGFPIDFKFESTYSLLDVAVPVSQRVGRSVEDIAAVQASVVNDTTQSIPRRSQELDIAQTT